MKFIEVTDGSGDKFLINLDRVERIAVDKWERSSKLHTRLYIVNDNKDITYYVQETYEQIKEMLNVR